MVDNRSLLKLMPTLFRLSTQRKRLTHHASLPPYTYIKCNLSYLSLS